MVEVCPTRPRVVVEFRRHGVELLVTVLTRRLGVSVLVENDVAVPMHLEIAINVVGVILAEFGDVVYHQFKRAVLLTRRSLAQNVKLLIKPLSTH